jgi:hypothetical protein
LARGLEAVVARLEPKHAARFCGPAAATLSLVVTKTTNFFAVSLLAKRLEAVVARLEPKGVAQVAATLTQGMAKTTNPFALVRLAEVLAAVAAWLEPREAARSCAQAAAILAQALGQPTNVGLTRTSAARSLAAVAARLEPKEAAAILSLTIAKTPERDSAEELARGLAGVLTRADTRELSRRAAAIVAAIGWPAGCGHPVSTPALLGPALAPLPCSLSTPDLVGLLKQPTCVGRARRVILDQLENRYRRPFADHWAFVRFAKQQKLDLDFTSPPQRPVLPATGEKK